MCIISGTINEVAKTKIFCGLNKDKTRQITIYSNEVDSAVDNNLMILPVPFIETVKFHDLSSYSNFFEDCEKTFYNSKSTNYSNSANDSFGIRSMSILKVFDVGSYKVSILDSVKDLGRLDTKQFHVTNEVAVYLHKFYNHKNIGFIVCKLNRGKQLYHPFAFSHKANSSKLYIPTKHYHVHSKMENLNYGSYASTYADVPKQTQLYSTDEMAEQDEDDWDHDIYIYNASSKGNNIVEQADSKKYGWTGKVKINFEKLDFDLDTECKNFQKINIVGSCKNIDIFVKTI